MLSERATSHEQCARTINPDTSKGAVIAFNNRQISAGDVWLSICKSYSQKEYGVNVPKRFK